MPDKFIELSSGQLKEKLPINTFTGTDGEIIRTDANGRIDPTLMPIGVTPLTKSIVSGENLPAGNFVNIYDDGGTPKVRKADASDPSKSADGYVLTAVTAPAAATVYFEDFNNQLSGLTGGNTLYLATTPGGVTATAPSGAGEIVQELGKAISATEMYVEIQRSVELA